MSRKYANNFIRDARKSRNLSMEELGAAMPSELTMSTISKLEKGHMALSLDYIREIAEVLHVSPIDLISDDTQQVNVIPVVCGINCGDWRGAVQMSNESIGIPGNIKGDSLFAIRPEGDELDRLVPEDGYIVLDPDQKELVNKKFYGIINEQSEVIYKQYFDAPPRLVPASTSSQRKTITLGLEPFLVIGRIIYVGAVL